MVLSGNDAGLRCLLRLTSFARSDIPSKLSRHPCRKSLSRSCQSRGGSEVALRSAALVLMLREWHLSAKRSRQNAMTSGDRKSHSTLGQFLTPSQRPLTRATPAQDVPAFKVRDALFQGPSRKFVGGPSQQPESTHLRRKTPQALVPCRMSTRASRHPVEDSTASCCGGLALSCRSRSPDQGGRQPETCAQRGAEVSLPHWTPTPLTAAPGSARRR